MQHPPYCVHAGHSNGPKQLQSKSRANAITNPNYQWRLPLAYEGRCAAAICKACQHEDERAGVTYPPRPPPSPPPAAAAAPATISSCQPTFYSPTVAEAAEEEGKQKATAASSLFVFDRAVLDALYDTSASVAHPGLTLWTLQTCDFPLHTPHTVSASNTQCQHRTHSVSIEHTVSLG